MIGHSLALHPSTESPELAGLRDVMREHREAQVAQLAKEEELQRAREVLKTLKLRYEEKSKDYEDVRLSALYPAQAASQLESLPCCGFTFLEAHLNGKTFLYAACDRSYIAFARAKPGATETLSRCERFEAVRLRFPQQEVAKRGPNLYEVKGRAVKLQLAPGRSGFLEPFVVDGPLKQPLDDYLSGSGRNEAWMEPPMVQSALHALPRPHRVSFEELYPTNRMEAMLLAVMEADARETHAKQKLSTSPSPEKRHRSCSNPPPPASASPGVPGPPLPAPAPRVPFTRTAVPSVIRGLPMHMASATRGRPMESRSVSPQRRLPVSPVHARPSQAPRPPVLVFGTVPQSPQSPGPAIPKVPEEESRVEVPAPFEPQKLLSLKELQEAFSALQSDVLSLQGELQSIRAARGDPGQQPTEASMALQSDDIAEAETDTSEDASTERSCRNLRRSWSEWSRTDKT
ncbi:unnamed protein product [Symbiodinium sp. KB8]|nr:unnamed protein product [Symbiodinium sp. KB8]